MNDPVHASVLERPAYGHSVGIESSVSAVSWGAVIAGAFVAAAMSLILLALGSGLGLSSVSPWDSEGASAKTIGIAGAVWLALMQLISATLGGYVAGRLRTKWVGVHNDEVYFRDTAHGFLVWAVGLVMTASFLTSAGMALVGTAQVGATALAAGGAVAAAQPGTDAANPNGYLVDRMLRREPPPANATSAPEGAANSAAPAEASTPPNVAETRSATADAETRSELVRMFAGGMRNGELSATDRSYAARVVAARTGLSQADAERRVDETVALAKQKADDARAAADTGRKAAAGFSLWVFVSLLLGAFCSSYAATRGGRRRDALA